MRRVGSCLSRVVGLLFFALLIVAFVGPAVYLEVAGKNLPAVIATRREPINVRYGHWNRQLLIEVQNPSPQTTDAGEKAELRGAQIAVLPELYDRLRVGEPVEVRYVPVPIPQLNALNNAGFARLAQQPPFGALIATVALLWWVGIIVALALALVFLWPTPLKNVALGVFGVFVVIFGLYSGSNWPPPEPSGPRAAAVATVRDITHVQRIWGGRRSRSEEAAQPFEIVELEFTPEGAAGPVVAVDLVDTDSAPGLQKGATLPIHYSVGDHRWAQLDTGTRTYYWKNLRTIALIAAFVVVLLVGGWIFGRRRRVQRANATP